MDAAPGTMDGYRAAFADLVADPRNTLLVGERHSRIVATCQLTVISGLSLRAARRMQVESVRVAADLRGQGIGEAMFAEIEARARAAGCSLIQLTMNAARKDAARFYARQGFTASHVGFKRDL
ncbi:MAG: GNAT family N-acetyltransferase [Limimaricola sp.]|nr:GNAT family N-acetyltransferase [Limimaricola sp.]